MRRTEVAQEPSLEAEVFHSRNLSALVGALDVEFYVFLRNPTHFSSDSKGFGRMLEIVRAPL